jgi:hypothetical protein
VLLVGFRTPEKLCVWVDIHCGGLAF